MITDFFFWDRKGQWFTVNKGPQFSTSTAKPETDLTVDMLLSSVHFHQIQWFKNSYSQKLIQWLVETIHL